MQIKILTSFDFAHRGVEVRHYAAGAVVDATDSELVDVALAQGWAMTADAEPIQAMRAPEDKDAARQRKPRGRTGGSDA